MSAAAIPASLRAAIRRFIRAALAASAALAVDAVVETPNVNWASSGTVVTIPVPWTVIVRDGAAATGEATATAAVASVSKAIVHFGLIGISFHTPPRAPASQRFGTEAGGKHRPGLPLTWP